MDMLTFKTGDLIARTHSLVQRPLQIGIVIEDDKDTFVVKWTSFNKDFFMEKSGDIFKELNNSFLLDTVHMFRSSTDSHLSLLNSSYSYGRRRRKTSAASQNDHETVRRKSA